MMVVAMTLLATAVFFGMSTTSKAQKQIYHGYVLSGKLPSKAKCFHYQRTHKGAERWRLWARMYAYRQVRYHSNGAKSWKRVWNEDWVIQIIYRESGGQQHPNNPTYRGLMQIYMGYVPYKLQNMLYVGWFNLKKAASMFAKPGYYGGPQPWVCNIGVPAYPYAAHK